jgi:hypothetical protein
VDEKVEQIINVSTKKYNSSDSILISHYDLHIQSLSPSDHSNVSKLDNCPVPVINQDDIVASSCPWRNPYFDVEANLENPGDHPLGQSF